MPSLNHRRQIAPHQTSQDNNTRPLTTELTG
nr:MAG TPA: hypothetical protein [Caudoviricetes sp.]